MRDSDIDVLSSDGAQESPPRLIGRNEAADRLRQWIGDESRPAWQALDEALAAERRATVERIREWLERYKRSEGTVWTENSDYSLEALLDEEAAR